MDLYWAVTGATGLLASLAVARTHTLRAALQVSEATCLRLANPPSVTASSTRVEQQLQQARKMEAIGRLAGGIAHDFNNLLTAITGYTELVAANLDLTDPMIQDVYEIRRAALSAGRLTKQLLAFSSNQRMHSEVLDVNAIVARTIALLRRTLGEDIDVTLTLSPDVKPIKADAGQIEQIVLNLAVNARDAMKHGGRLTVTTTMRACGVEHAALEPDSAAGDGGDYVRLTVEDTGCGMSEETQSKVFEPFFTTKGTVGTGLGLATVYGIVAQSRGQIAIASTVGVGTTFTIDLPATT